ncbi:FAD-dependent oxidoreductase [Sneathiella marina]|uniref:FAD-dependent oxidoreductase n=1 Tax=Sneathiella marina TaxID=2950108 RepID=A0ABY4W451_9PROT|nr:FAD-dependent oxidoreductase [Sneathiella marina]USG61977.1 FAD-dependent oxidoreductase [Sneathiella marina]
MQNTAFQPYWFAQALQREASVTPVTLTRDTNADVCIVGGGYTGLWTALHLKKQKPSLDIVVIDKGLCGSGASGRNGGCMVTWSGKYFTLLDTYGAPEAARLVRASEQALFHIRDFCHEHQIEAEVRVDGLLNTATNGAQLGALDNVISALEGERLNNWQHWSVEKIQEAAGSTQHIEGVFSPIGGSLHPGMLVRGLRRVAIERGVRIYENTPLLALENSRPASVKTPNAVVTARKTVLALNAWMPTLFPAFGRNIMLVSSDMAITKPAPDLLAEIGLLDGKAVIDSRAFVHYYRRTAQGRLMMGKGGNMISLNNAVTPKFDRPSRYATQLRGAIDRFFPTLASTDIEATWTGPSDRSTTGLPFFGSLEGNPDIVYGLGYSGNGVGQSYVGAQFLTAMVLGQDNEWTRSTMAKGPLGAFPPEPIRWLGAMLVKNAIQRKERREDRGRPAWWLDRQLAKIAATTAGRLKRSKDAT